MHINHVLVRTTDLAAMHSFWVDLIGLEAGYRPQFSRPGAWFYSDGQPLIHVVEVERVDAGGSLDHVALEGADLTSLITRLQQHNASFHETVVPGSNDRQVFVAGPDGLQVELLFPSRNN